MRYDVIRSVLVIGTGMMRARFYTCLNPAFQRSDFIATQSSNSEREFEVGNG